MHSLTTRLFYYATTVLSLWSVMGGFENEQWCGGDNQTILSFLTYRHQGYRAVQLGQGASAYCEFPVATT
jgi:hypothetical protein